MNIAMRWMGVISLLLAATLSASEPPVSLRLSTGAGQAPMGVLIMTRVQPDERNRGLCLRWESEDVEGQACWQFTGHENALELRQTYPLRDLPAGNYVFIAILMRDGGNIRSAPVTLRVMGGEV